MYSLLGFDSDFYGVDELPDLFAIGFQELPVSLTAVLQQDPWVTQADQVLKPWDLVRVKQTRMQGLLLALYCKRHLVPEVRGLRAVHTKTSASRIMGSKGGVSISCKVSGVSVVVTCAHLAAHVQCNDKRIRDYASIVDQNFFSDEPQTKYILSHDYAIFMGDLNFRICVLTERETHVRVTQGLSSPSVQHQVIKDLLSFDQLTRVRSEGLAFSEFLEPDITFMPTYKFIVGSNHHDLRRTPSWTDRILYRYTANAYEAELPSVRLSLSAIKYTCHPDYTSSDHKPVSALFVFKAFSREVYEAAKQLEPPRLAFLPVDWRNGQVNTVWFTVTSRNARLEAADFVAIYPSEFTSLDQEMHRSLIDSRQETKDSPSTAHHSPDHVRQIVWFTCSFSAKVLLPPSSYRLLYISSQSSDVLSLSPPWTVAVT